MRSVRPILLFAAALSVFASCKTETTCDAVARRNAACADAFVEVAKQRARATMAERLETLPPASREKATAKLEERYEKAAQSVRETLTSEEFLNDCRRDWNDPAKMPPALKKELNRCISLPACPAYAACFIESASLSPKAPM